MACSKTTSSPLRFVAVGQSLIKRDLRDDPSKGWKEIQKIIQATDIAFTNFEGTLRGSHGGWPMKDGLTHASDPVVLDTLKEIGFNAVSLSNNHAFDWGSGGILSTLEEVGKRGFLHAGIGANKVDASRPGILDTDKGRVAMVSMDASPQPDHFYAGERRPGINRQRVIETLALRAGDFDHLKAISDALGYEKRKAEYIRYGFRTSFEHTQEFYGIRFEVGARTEERYALDQEDRDRNLKAVRDAAREADFVIVYVHHHYWESSWELPPVWLQEFARQCIDAGGNAFVSHGVPMLQGIEIYQRRPIFYSLGNFIFHTGKKAAYARDSIWQSVVASCEFDDEGRLITVELTPISLGGHGALQDHDLSRDVPHRVDGEYGEGILARLAGLSLPFRTRIDIEDARGRVVI